MRIRMSDKARARLLDRVDDDTHFKKEFSSMIYDSEQTLFAVLNSQSSPGFFSIRFEK